MKISDIDDNIKFSDFENFFNIYEDKRDSRKLRFFNLNSSIYLKNLPLEEYEVDHDTFWNTLSYKIYGTTRLWWLLMKINNVQVEDIFSPVVASSKIKIVSDSVARQIIGELDEQ